MFCEALTLLALDPLLRKCVVSVTQILAARRKYNGDTSPPLTRMSKRIHCNISQGHSRARNRVIQFADIIMFRYFR